MARPKLAQSSLPAFVAWLVMLLQVVGALHFALVPHGFSASLGGVVHVHQGGKAVTRGASPPSHDERSHAVASDGLSCSADLCTVADAPNSAPPEFSLEVSGAVAFGAVRLLAEPSVAATDARRVRLSAPKTSPPV